jgi:hypothetical protein
MRRASAVVSLVTFSASCVASFDAGAPAPSRGAPVFDAAAPAARIDAAPDADTSSDAAHEDAADT